MPSLTPASGALCPEPLCGQRCLLGLQMLQPDLWGGGCHPGRLTTPALEDLLRRPGSEEEAVPSPAPRTPSSVPVPCASAPTASVRGGALTPHHV